MNCIRKYEYIEQEFYKKMLDSLKAEFIKQNWNESFIKNITLEDVHLIGYEISDGPGEAKNEMDWVDKNTGLTILPEEETLTSSDSFDKGRPIDKKICYLGRNIIISFFHDGSILNVIYF